MRNYFYIIFSGLIFLSFGCNNDTNIKKEALDSTVVQGNLMILSDEVMDVTVKEIARQFEKEYPHIKLITESGGSRKMALKIADDKKRCDIFISSDYQVISNLLHPKNTKWILKFATNEIVIAFTDKSPYSDSISTNNWYRVLLSEDVKYGRVDPDYAPIGYRAAICIKLAEKYYGEFGIKDLLLFKDKEYIHSSEKEAISNLENNTIDYLFTYKSTAEQKHLKYILLPDQINLGSSDYSSYYAMSNLKVSDKNPGKYIVHTGNLIRFGLCSMSNTSNPRATEAFIDFFINTNQGLKIIQESKLHLIEPLELTPKDSTTLDVQEWLKI
ncbi:MAG: hypothetical protein DRI84_01905 [Bacteroidetes bacterium]|nr:MAG: hypothetical protein DRI84_01905 [Bacteroidota bacterium]